MKEQLKIAWAAGFIDGEAYIGVTRCWYKDHYNYRGVVNVGQVSPTPLYALRAILGGSVRASKDKFGTHYQWVLNGKHTVKALRSLLPYLVAKKRQAELVLEFYSISNPELRNSRQQWRVMPAEVSEHRESIHAMLMALNSRRSHRDRLSESAPTGNAEGDATVGSHGNDNHESTAEMTVPETVQ